MAFKFGNQQLNAPETIPTTTHVLFVEHPPVYTLGKNGKAEHVLISEADRLKRGIEYFHINRGGDITFHGPGQLVGYPILDLERFKTDLGWEEAFNEVERDILETIINPVENYETIRYINEPYSGVTGDICDIWYFFYFLNNQNPKTYNNGLDYNLIGISPKENALLLKHTVKSFFRLEFYTTPDRETQKLVFAKNLSIPLGQKVYDKVLMDSIFVPVFNGNNFRNTENMYLFWFPDNSVFTGNTFYMTARFFNAEDGTVVDFTNKNMQTLSGPTTNIRIGTRDNPILFYEKGIRGASREVNEETDMYYKVYLTREYPNYSFVYQVVDVSQ
jgi:hypothetical protein